MKLPKLAMAAWLFAAPAWAEDRSDGVTPGRFRAEPARGATLSSARIVLDGEQVRVVLEITVRIGGAIRLDLPRFGWLGEAETYSDRHFPELKVDLDGRAVSPADAVAVTESGRDITSAVQAAGVDPFAIAETPPFVGPVPGRLKAFDALVASGAVTKEPEGFFARWRASRTVRVFPVRGAHVLTYRYTARPAFALSSATSADVRWADYCMTPGTGARLLARRGLAAAFIAKRYAVPATLDGARPPTLTLRASAASGTTTIACGKGGTALIDADGEVAVKAGSDGAVHVLRISRPG